MINDALYDELALWLSVEEMDKLTFGEGFVAAHDMAVAMPNMSQSQAAVTGIIMMTGGYDVTAFKPNTV